VLIEGKRYVSPRLEPILARAVRLPEGVAAEESCTDLFRDTSGLLRRHLGQTEMFITALVFYIFGDWFFDVLSIAPILLVVAPIGSPRESLLQLLSALCRRPLRVAGARRADFKSFPMWLSPTLVLDEPEMRPSMLKLLHTTTRRGSYVPFGHSLLDLWGPKIICTYEFPGELGLANSSIRLAMTPAVGQLEDLDGNLIEIAQKYQPRFLGQRLRNLRTVRLPDFEVSEISQPARDLARILGAAIVGDDGLQRQILPIIAAQDEEARTERSRSVKATLVEALFFFSLQEERHEVRSAELADKTNSSRYGRREFETISPESVGWILKDLGMHTRRLGSAGNGVKLTQSTRRFIHRLAIAYDVRTMQGHSKATCRYCADIAKLGI
jgi:hypothetical protein